MPLSQPANCRRIGQRNTDTEDGLFTPLDGMKTVIITAMTDHVSGKVTGDNNDMSGNVAVTMSGRDNPDSGKGATRGGKVSGTLNTVELHHDQQTNRHDQHREFLPRFHCSRTRAWQ